MKLSRALVIIRLSVSLLLILGLSYFSYQVLYLNGHYHEFRVLMAFFILVIVWAAVSQLRFHRISPDWTEFYSESKVGTQLRISYMICIFVGFFDFVSLNLTRIRTYEEVGLYAGIGLFLVACLVRWWAYISIGDSFHSKIALYKSHKLVTSGAYRLVRHPLYLGMLIELISFSLMFASVAALVVSLTYVLYMVIKCINVEEDMMAGAFKEEYDEYRRHSKKLVPYIY